MKKLDSLQHDIIYYNNKKCSLFHWKTFKRQACHGSPFLSRPILMMSFIVRNMRFKVGNMTETETCVVNVTTSGSYAFIVTLMILCRVSLSDEELLLNQVLMCRAVVGQQEVLWQFNLSEFSRRTVTEGRKCVFPESWTVIFSHLFHIYLQQMGLSSENQWAPFCLSFQGRLWASGLWDSIMQKYAYVCKVCNVLPMCIFTPFNADFSD